MKTVIMMSNRSKPQNSWYDLIVSAAMRTGFDAPDTGSTQTLQFLSDFIGPDFNSDLYAVDVRTKAIRQLTSFPNGVVPEFYWNRNYSKIIVGVETKHGDPGRPRRPGSGSSAASPPVNGRSPAGPGTRTDRRAGRHGPSRIRRPRRSGTRAHRQCIGCCLPAERRGRGRTARHRVKRQADGAERHGYVRGVWLTISPRSPRSRDSRFPIRHCSEPSASSADGSTASIPEGAHRVSFSSPDPPAFTCRRAPGRGR